MMSKTPIIKIVLFGLLVVMMATTVVVAATRNFRTHLSGQFEVPANSSKGQGQATLQLSKEGSALHYKLNIANIENVIMAHIHLEEPGKNGPIVVWLRPGGPPAPAAIPGRFQGTYAEGTITDANLVGPLAGQGLDALVEAIEDGRTYVNVHTSQFPGGEIRGDIP
jgi:hypothetical protein